MKNNIFILVVYLKKKENRQPQGSRLTVKPTRSWKTVELKFEKFLFDIYKLLNENSFFEVRWHGNSFLFWLFYPTIQPV